jgi:hypothetical protein
MKAWPYMGNLLENGFSEQAVQRMVRDNPPTARRQTAAAAAA